MNNRMTILNVKKGMKEIEKILSKYSSLDEFPPIERDLVLEKLRNLYNSFSFPGSAEKEKQIPDSKKGSLEEKSPGNIPADEKKEKKKDVQETDLLTIDAEDKDSTEDADTLKEDKYTIVAEKYKKSDTSLHETIANSKEADIASTLQSKPISNIASAIGVNDRFLFINELFKGDTDQYNQTIKVLNDAANFNEAYNYIFEHFDWDMDSDIVQKILELVRRKHIISTHE